MYEQNGADRAQYGQKLFSKLSTKLHEIALVDYHPRELRRCREFYMAYPEIGGTVSPEFTIAPEKLITSLSYSRFLELMSIDDPLHRVFYEVECIRGQWSVRELRRQISSLLFERTGMSRDKAKLAEHVRLNAETMTPALAIRNPYVFEFLGIKSREVMAESELRTCCSIRFRISCWNLEEAFVLKHDKKGS